MVNNKECLPFSHLMSPSVIDSAKGGQFTVFTSPSVKTTHFTSKHLYQYFVLLLTWSWWYQSWQNHLSILQKHITESKVATCETYDTYNTNYFCSNELINKHASVRKQNLIKDDDLWKNCTKIILSHVYC